MSDDILPCPFCGGKARESHCFDESLWSHEIVTWYSVSCPACDYEMTQCKDHNELVKAWNRRDAKSDTITIPRDLFERLCKSAIMADEYHQWLREMSGVIDDDDDCEWKQLINEAVAIRDGGTKE